jgi:hypothetical protein
MASQDYDVKIRMAYLRFKWRIALYFTLWLIALVAGGVLLVAIIFFNHGLMLKMLFLALVVLLFIKLAYGANRHMRHQYDSFKEENGMTDTALRKL